MKRKSFDESYYRVKDNVTSELSFAVEGLTQPDIDVADITQVIERIKLYFERCDQTFQEPGVAGLCLWLGITTERWKDWCSGAEFNTTHRKYCERVMTLLESRLETRMTEGKVNPVTAMFLLKSQFGYVDTPTPKKSQKQTVVREMPLGEILKLAQKK